ncbi:hypothetical protein [Microcoleus vaginatus]
MNHVLNAKVPKRRMKLAQVNQALQAEISARQRCLPTLAIEAAPQAVG